MEEKQYQEELYQGRLYQGKPYQGKPALFDNTREALAYIATVHGMQVLLSDHVEALLTEVAPQLPALSRNRVHAVINSGAASVLKVAMDVSEDAQEKAYDQAMKAVIENFGISPNLVEEILTEFIDALGWEIGAATPQTEVERLARKPEMKVSAIYADLKVGQRNVSFGKYKWRVLDVRDGKALLLSENILEERKYHHEYVSITWEQCDLRSYLNGEFLRTFAQEEQGRVATVSNINEDNQWLNLDNSSAGNDTKDKIYLLSITEVVKYFGDSGQLEKNSSDDDPNLFISDQYNDARKVKYGEDWSWWWLRSPGGSSYGAAVVSIEGDIWLGSLAGFYVHSDGVGVRPALWLNL
jgi:hypothetical protein